ncbi:hypothetical protein PTKIN_Ptkin14bG0210500 [Pterospermum kingtungense]
MGMLVWPFEFLSFPLFILLLSQAVFSSSPHLCPPEQSRALLQFKNIISLKNCSSIYGLQPRKIQSWKEGSDCCLWDGVSCDNVTGNVIGLDLANCFLCGTIDSNRTLFLLSHLQRLDLSSNNFVLPEFPSTISGQSYYEKHGSKHDPFERVVLLGGVSMSDVAPHSLLNLSSFLTTLDLDTCSLGENLGGEFPVNIFQLPNLQWIRLSHNPMIVHFPKSNWTSPLRFLEVVGTGSTGLTGIFHHCIGDLKYLEHIRVDGKGELPNSIGNLVSLKRLILGGIFTGSIPASIGNLSQINEIDLYNDDFRGELPLSLGKLQNLMDLYLAGNNFTGQIPNAFTNLTKLTRINFHSNNFNGQLPLSLFNLTQPVDVDFSVNQLTGPLPSDIKGHAGLVYLDISDNLLKGTVPSWLFALPLLNHLDLSYNQLDGFNDEFQVNSSQLVDQRNEAYISHNLIKGTVPSWLFALPSLNHLDLSYNQLDGFNNDFQVNSSQLVCVDISYNKLRGPIPRSLFELVHLRDLSLSSNNMTGSLDLEMISKLKNLSSLHLSYNSLVLSSSSPVNYTFPMFWSLHLSSCNLSQFPILLKDSKYAEEIDLSDNKIHGHVPEWFLGLGGDSLRYLNLSHNFLTSFSHFPWNTLNKLDLRSNLLQGSLLALPLPRVALSLSKNMFSGEIPASFCNIGSFVNILDLSNNNLNGIIPQCLGNVNMRLLDLRMNKLSGKIPPSFCNGSYLEILDLSNNNLNGTIPQCLGNLGLSVLDLRMNNFSGAIPEEFVNCEFLTTLGLNGNKLEGLLPRSLLKCTTLEVLDVGNNQISGEFPHWLGSLPNLQVLVLRSNKFQGPIANPYRTKFPFRMLRIIDVSHNEFTGPLPAFYFKNFKAMMTVDQNKSELKYMGDDYYEDHMMVTMKGINIELVRILSILTTIDLSNNNFSGEIPANIGKLKSLKGLNFSHNKLEGHIPSTMGSLTNLEWLDLSSNRLAGKIPEELLDVTSLEVLNLSYNKLEGHIPEGRQFNTFSNDSYVGNLGLCGFPLSKKCNQQPPPPSFVTSGSKIGFGWKVVALGYGCGVLFGMFMGYLVFSTGKPQWLVRLVEEYQPRGKLRRPRNGRRHHGNRRN